VHLVLLLVLPLAVVLVAATGGRLVLALALVLVGWFLVAAGARYAEQLRKPYLVPLKVLDASAADILALAELQADLGPGAEVLFAGDVPR
jgi:uncharacterized membrane protein YGL010W